MTKFQIIAALRAFAAQRSGIEFGNYGDVSAFRSEQRSITKDLQQAREMLRYVELRDSITAEMLIAAFPRAYSGRLSLSVRYQVNGKGAFKMLAEAQEKANSYLPAIVEVREIAALDYCAGQYFPTEYRRAVCAVLASAIWELLRADMPAPSGKVKRVSGFGAFRHESEHDSINGMSPGDYLRKTARREFGRGIASRWFN